MCSFPKKHQKFLSVYLFRTTHFDFESGNDEASSSLRTRLSVENQNLNVIQFPNKFCTKIHFFNQFIFKTSP